MRTSLFLFVGLLGVALASLPLASGCSSFSAGDPADSGVDADADATPHDAPDASDNSCAACFAAGEDCCASASNRCVAHLSGGCMTTELTASCTANTCPPGQACCGTRSPLTGFVKSLKCETSCAAMDTACEDPAACDGGMCTPDMPLTLKTCH